MAGTKPIISPKTKIGELLDAWPQLEEVLISMSPVFARLKNPVLRRTVARVATIQQISVVGGLPVDQIINRLRSEVGLDEQAPDAEDTDHLQAAPPAWFDESMIKLRFDASPLINSGGSPMAEVLRMANSLKPGEILELKTPFVPAPVLDMLRNKNYRSWSTQSGAEVLNYISPA